VVLRCRRRRRPSSICWKSRWPKICSPTRNPGPLPATRRWRPGP